MDNSSHKNHKMSAEKIERLEKEFQIHAPLDMGRLFILPAKVAIEYLNRSEKEGLILLGLDAFKLHTDGGIQPFLEHSPDYSRTDLPYIDHKERYALARELVSAPELQDFYFEIVLDASEG